MSGNSPTHIHQANHKDQKLSCQQCIKKFTTRAKLQRHLISVHEGKKFPCPYCEYKATEKGSCLKHIKSVHQGQRKASHALNVIPFSIGKETFKIT